MADNEQGQISPAKTTDPEFQETGSQPQPKIPVAGTKKIFSRSSAVREVVVKVALPDLYPDFEPWVFNLRLKLSQDAEERRQEYLTLTPTEMTVKEPEQNLDELCDLLVSMPGGFEDLQEDGNGPGSSFKNYVLTASPGTKDMLLSIVRGAISLYWRKTSPQEFRKSV